MEFSYDELGPEAVINVYDPETGMRGVIVLDNLVRGPAKGGIRMAPSADTQEVLGLARAMTLKNALADLPFGGGKSGIVADPKQLSAQDKESLVRAFAKKLSLVAPEHYVAAPDIAMAEDEMRVIADVAGPRAITGKPEDLGGMALQPLLEGAGVHTFAAPAEEQVAAIRPREQLPAQGQVVLQGGDGAAHQGHEAFVAALAVDQQAAAAQV